MLLKYAKVLLLLSLISGLFGYWGAFTKPGNQLFDEMSGIIPYFFGFGISILSFSIAFILLLVRFVRAANTKRKSHL
jgi:hypothetical protein